jgi:non-homologous end joining protein Ku
MSSRAAKKCRCDRDTIDIDEFAQREEIDPRYIIRPYSPRPDGNVGYDAFAVTIVSGARDKAGAMVFARTIDDEKLSKEVLSETRASLPLRRQ